MFAEEIDEEVEVENKSVRNPNGRRGMLRVVCAAEDCMLRFGCAIEGYMLRVVPATEGCAPGMVARPTGYTRRVVKAA